MRLNIKKIFSWALVSLSFLSLTSCGGKKEGNDDKDKIYDSITNKCDLQVSYDNKDFITDGIGKATLVGVTDGDTATFRLDTASNTTVRIRFFGVDTPESTAGVEKWGKAASLFTDGRLNSGTEWVLEASTTPASVDSYGERYLAYIWYKDGSKFKNVNLQLVENGYSKNNCSNTSAYKYYSYFAEAETFAKKKPLHIWDDDAVDEYYDDSAKDITLKNLNDNLSDYYNSETQVGAKVRFSAAVKSVTGSSTYTYKVGQIVDGAEYTFTVYGGYTSSGIPGYIKVGSEYQFTGTVQKYNSSYQISGLTYVPMESGGDYLSRVQKDKFITFDSSITDEMKIKQYEKTALFGDLTITNAEIKDGYILYKGNATALADSTNTKEFTIRTLNSNNVEDVSSNVGKKIKTTGYQEETGIIDVLDVTNIKIN